MLRLALFLLLLPGGARAGGSFDGGYGIWSPAGLWHRVTPPACVTPHSGVACVYYGIDGACNYANGQIQDASLTTAAPVTLNLATATLSFWLLYDVQSFDPACQDRLILEHSPDGLNWFNPQYLTIQPPDPVGGSPVEGFASGGGVGGPALWQFRRIDLAPFVGVPYYWRFRYVSSDYLTGNNACNPPDLYQGTLGFALDDIEFTDVPLTLDKSVAPSFGSPGDTFTFTLTATNTGPMAANVSVWDTLPAGFAYVAAPGGSVILDASGNSLAQWMLANVPAGGPVSVQLLVQAAPGLSVPADWINTAAAASSLTTTPVLSSQVWAKIRAPGLTLVKSVQPKQLTSGDVATYSIVVENDTPLTQSATLADNLPTAFSVVYPSAGSTFGGTVTMPPGQVLSFALWGPVYGQDGQVVVNTAQLSGSSGAPIQASASLLVHKAVQPTISIQALFPNPAPAHGAGQPQEAFVAYNLSAAMPVTLDVFDVAGEKVRRLAAPGNQGLQQVAWDLKNAYGRRVASGVYILRLWSPLQVQPSPQAVGYLSVLQ